VKIGIVQRADVENVRALSGIPYFMAKALREHVGETVNLGPDNGFPTRSIEYAGRVINRVSYTMLKRRISSDHHRILAKHQARTFGKRVAQSSCDVILAPNAGVEIAYLSTSIPIIYYTDLTWASIVDYYPNYSALFRFSRAEADLVEAAAIEKASKLILPSQWAAQEMIGHYRVDPTNVYCIPCGANFEKADIPPRAKAMQHRIDREVVLLWVGIDWERKGGTIAYDCLIEMLRNGVEARLIVCGCIPPEFYRHPKMEIIPFLDKRDPLQQQKLSELFLKAHFFLFPTMAEAFGIVLCEASAHGLPSIARDTGGVGGAITDGENGYLMPHDALGQQYATKILRILEDHRAYYELVRTSRMAYERALNWDAWGRAAKPIFEQAVDESRIGHGVRAIESGESEPIRIDTKPRGVMHGSWS
jgi:glycosyltransferase involved in cell wall biosynthesis